MGKREKEEPDFFKVDELHLFDEWGGQPALVYEHRTKLAEARRKAAEAKAALKVAEAELARDIRAMPTAFGLPDKHPANDVVDKTVLLQKEHRGAVSELINADYEVDMLEAAVQTLEHRKKALEKMVEMVLAGLRGEPRLPSKDQRLEAAERRAAFGGGKKVTKGGR